MKKIISAVLTVSMIMGATTIAFAQPLDKVLKPALTSVTARFDTEISPTQKKDEVKKSVNEKAIKVDVKKASALDKSKVALVKKCDEMIAQLTKLKSYIISKDGKFLVSFKSQAAGDTVLKSIDESIAKVEAYKVRINAAQTSKELKELSKELQNSILKHQTIVKRITGLTSAARLKIAYDETKILVDKLGAGIDGITGTSIKLDIVALKVDYTEIKVALEAAHVDYLDAVALFSSLTDSNKADKDFKVAQAKLKEAQKELHDVLVETKQLLNKIKTSALKELNVNKVDSDDDDQDDDDDDDDDNDDL